MNKFDRCYHISSLIIDKYVQLLNYFTDEETKKKIINELQQLVMEEYDVISSMSLEEIETYLEIISKNRTQNSTPGLIRVMNRIHDFMDVLQGNFITASELGITDSFNDIKFSIYGSILAMIDLNVVKSLKRKLDSLVISSNNDKVYISLLYGKLQRSKIDFLFTTSPAEIVSLLNNTDIDKISNIDPDNIRKKINTLYGNNNDLKFLLDNTIAWYIKEVIKELSEVKIVNNNPYDIYSYLVSISQFEVLISYLDRRNLCSVYNYCCNLVNLNNYASMENAKRLIREYIIKFDKK